jgi:RNA polymerase sigma factor (sigma-70 family)
MFPTLDEATLFDIAVEAVLKLGETPEKYDPDLLSLASYLRMDARGDALHALERARKRQFRETSLESVELLPPGRNSVVDGATTADPADEAIENLERARLARWLDELQGADREVVQLIWDGERRTPTFARVLGLEHLPPDEQEREVKRAKDRLKARLKRRRGGMTNHD